MIRKPFEHPMLHTIRGVDSKLFNSSTSRFWESEGQLEGY
jgi:hypothetical protein